MRRKKKKDEERRRRGAGEGEAAETVGAVVVVVGVDLVVLEEEETDGAEVDGRGAPTGLGAMGIPLRFRPGNRLPKNSVVYRSFLIPMRNRCRRRGSSNPAFRARAAIFRARRRNTCRASSVSGRRRSARRVGSRSWTTARPTPTTPWSRSPDGIHPSPSPAPRHRRLRRGELPRPPSTRRTPSGPAAPAPPVRRFP